METTHFDGDGKDDKRRASALLSVVVEGGHILAGSGVGIFARSPGYLSSIA
jgi:hypothetical protein